MNVVVELIEVRGQGISQVTASEILSLKMHLGL